MVPCGVAAPNPLVSSRRHWGSSASLLPAAVGMEKPVLDCRNWFLLLAWLCSRATQLQPRRACSAAFAGPFSATLGYPVRGPGAVAT